MVCPNCKKKDTRRIAVNKYYCRNCCYELDKDGDKIMVYLISEKGRRINVKIKGMS